MLEVFSSTWTWITIAVHVTADVWATAHIALFKRDNRSALGWIGLVWFLPLCGPLLYLMLGINRIRRKAILMRKQLKRSTSIQQPHDNLSIAQNELEPLRKLISEVTRRPLSGGNRIGPLQTGEEAYRQMLAAIAAAKSTVGLSTYIFDNDSTGHSFLQALAEAVGRGVEVRVLIDAIGARYSFPSIVGKLRSAQVPVARFLPSLLPWHFNYAQLRNHRKLLIVDGCLGFTGGMNIRDGHDARTHPKHPITDCHFRVEGHVVADMRDVFADDWQFASGEQLSGTKWFPDLQPVGEGLARGIVSGPDDNFETLRLTFLGAIACAKQSLRIVSPYFLPDSDIISNLGVAALRGVVVDIFVPERNNLKLVHWAMLAQLSPLLKHGCRIWFTPPPFDHAKLLVVDDRWCLIGSANWDSRSLRLNFEFDIESYDLELVATIDAIIDRKQAQSRQLMNEELRHRSLLNRLRDGLARLASPYL